MTPAKTTTTFQELGVSPSIIKALEENGFETPFPIQMAAIPLVLKGVDVIGQAHTGTGKTAAFALPILTRIKTNQKGQIQALVLVPTRELALQVASEFNKFAKYTGIRTIAIYGGQSIRYQFKQLRGGVEIVVATPGRLIDHLKQDSVRLDDVKFVVLDEADRMLDMGFIDDIKFILFYINQERQTCLFSATMPPEIMRMAQEYMHDAKEVMLNQELSLDTIEQCYLIIREKEKFKHLCNIIKNREKKQTIVFAATKKRTQSLANELKQEGFRASTIHGDLSQGERENAMHKFRKGAVDILVATDIAARGIDVPAVGHIINYDIPSEPLMYFHRIGRTARAGGRGKAISLVAHDRVDAFYRILRKTKHPIRRLNEEMGIGFIISQKSPIERHRTRPNYRHNISHQIHGRYTDNRNMRSHREQRKYHRRYQK